MNLTSCESCGKSVLRIRVAMGHEVLFDADVNPRGKWWPDRYGVMQRLGRLLMKPGYLPHARSCRPGRRRDLRPA